MVRILSFSSYLRAKNPLKQDFFSLDFFSTGLVLGASLTDLSTVFVAVFAADFSVVGLVDLALEDLVDVFGFFVAIISDLLK